MRGTAQDPMVNILLADDDDDERYFFETALRKLPTIKNLTTVSDGEQLMKYLSQKEDGLPDILFLDIMMPRKNGIECLKEIKSNEKLNRIPVVMYSNSVGDDYVSICYKCGASYFLQKGIYAELPDSIEKLLSILAKIPAPVTKEKFKFSLQETYETNEEE